MSPRAAWRLEALGFGEVYDYVPGKRDWLARGLPVEGTQAGEPTAGTVARRDVPACGPHDRVGDVRAKAAAAGVCVVVNEQGIVAGILRAAELASPDGAAAGEVMRTGPSTFRPSVAIAEMADHMTEHDLQSAPITSPDGRLTGVLFREDAVLAAREGAPEA